MLVGLRAAGGHDGDLDGRDIRRGWILADGVAEVR